MTRRSLLRLAPLVLAAPALPFQAEKSRLKITGVRLVSTRPKRPVPQYKPAPGSWSTGGVEVANPMSIYPEYKAERSLFMPSPGQLEAPTAHFDRPGKGATFMAKELALQQAFG